MASSDQMAWQKGDGVSPSALSGHSSNPVQTDCFQKQRDICGICEMHQLGVISASVKPNCRLQPGLLH